MTYREKALRLLESWGRQGVRETSYNWGGFVSVINAIWGRAPWCQAALYHAFKSVGRPIVKTNTVTVFADWAKRNGMQVPASTAARGDVIVFEWDGYWPGFYQWRDILDHVGMVAERKGNLVRIAEGNASDRVRLDRWFSVYDYRVKGFFRVPGGEVDPKKPGAPYVTRPYPLPRMYKVAGKGWFVRLGKAGKIIGRRLGYRAAKRLRAEKLAYWMNRNKNRR